MSYTPRHAKPASHKDAALSRQHAAGLTETPAGRHARNTKPKRDPGSGSRPRRPTSARS